MPISPIVMQRRLTEVGRIRIGELVPTASGKTRPSKLSAFRFTSADRSLLDQISNLYGGDVKAWVPQGGGASQWEVVTDASSVPVVVPPQSVTQWLERWSGGGVERRCSGERMVLTDSPCLCSSENEISCKPTTRLSVMLREIQSIGVFRLESKGWNAAAELPGMADLLARAGGYVEARLYLKPVRQVSAGKTKDFYVPALAVDGITPAQLLAGGGSLADANGEIRVTPEVKAISPAPSCDAFIQRAMDSRSSEDVRSIWRDASAAGCMDAEVTVMDKVMPLKAMLETLGKGFAEQESKAAPAGSPAEKVALWTQCMAAAPDGWGTDQVLSDWYGSHACEPADASIEELSAFLVHLQNVGPELDPEDKSAVLEQPEW